MYLIISYERVVGLLLFGFLFVQKAQSQNNRDRFIIDSVAPTIDFAKSGHLSKNKDLVKALKNKWQILSFWSDDCAPCFKSLSKTNQLQEKYSKNVAFVLIGPSDKESRELFKRVRQKLHLRLSIIFDESLTKRFSIDSFPFIVIIDEKGIVRGITNSIKENDLLDFFSGIKPSLPAILHDSDIERQYQRTLAFLRSDIAAGSENKNLLYYSLLSKWPAGGPFPLIDYLTSLVIYGNRYLAPRIDLKTLYKIAYGDTLPLEPGIKQTNYGKWWREPILEVKDSSPFEIDLETGKNIYNYIIMVDSQKAVVPYFQNCMQRDLKNYFGYSVEVETRKMPYWSLVAIRGLNESLISKADSTSVSYGYDSIKLRHVPVSEVIQALWMNFQLEPPFIDETGITNSIDVCIDAVTGDFPGFLTSLKKSGLNLQKKERDMKVIVIRDSQSPVLKR